MIEDIVPGTTTKFKIIKTLYEKQGLNLTTLIKEVKGSPNRVLDYINKLCQYKIVKEEKIGGKKKTHIRRLMPNLDSYLGKFIFSLVEINKRDLFYKKYNFLKNYFKELENFCNEEIKFILVYGSYARLSATKESDIDILIVGKITKEKIKRIRELFITLEIEPSIKIETEKKFIQGLNKPLHQNLIKEHIIIYGEINFINIMCKTHK